MKQQIIIIHGGDTFKTYKEYLKFLKAYKLDFGRIQKRKKDWKENLSKKLGKRFEIIFPTMPNGRNAKYLEWKIWFEKFIPYLKSGPVTHPDGRYGAGIILIGHSLGGIFLAKYLSENKFPKKILATLLVSAPYDDKGIEESLGDFTLPKSLNKLEKQGGKIFIYHSQNDPIVPFTDFKKYQKNLKTAEKRIFKDRGHFNQEKFPELIKDIKNL